VRVSAHRQGYVLLEDGAWFPGTAPLPFEPAYAEVVFTTNLSGYQEVFTDPSYLGQIVGDLERGELRQWAASGEGGGHWDVSVWVKLYQSERAHLVGVCRAAIAAGIAERQVQLAERQGELVGELLKVAVEAANLTPPQREAAYAAVRGHLARVA